MRFATVLAACFAFVALAAVCPYAAAEQIVLYSMPTGDTNKNPSDVLEHVTASTWENYGGTGVSTSTRTSFLRASDSASDAAGAIANEDYWDFTVAAETGYELDLDNLTFPIGGTSGGQAGYTATFFVRSSLDGYADTIPGSTTSVNVPSGLSTSGSNYSQVMLETLDLDLTDPAFQDLSEITFRVYVYDNATSNHTDQIPRLSQVQLNGTVAEVPEPSTLALAVLGLLGLAVWGKRRVFGI